jgi:hypothetical protein
MQQQMKAELGDLARRDWDVLTVSKAAHWADQKKRYGPASAIRAAEALRQQVATLRPDWPTEEDRREDLATHARVAACLRIVVSNRAH